MKLSVLFLQRCHSFSIAVTVTIVMMVSVQPVNAQRRVPRVHPATATKIAAIQTKMMDQRMKLEGNQKVQVNKINQIYVDRLTGLLNNQNLPKEEKLKELQRIHADKKADLKTVLTADQYQEYLKLQQELKEQRLQRIKDTPEEGSDQ